MDPERRVDPGEAEVRGLRSRAADARVPRRVIVLLGPALHPKVVGVVVADYGVPHGEAGWASEVEILGAAARLRAHGKEIVEHAVCGGNDNQ